MRGTVTGRAELNALVGGRSRSEQASVKRSRIIAINTSARPTSNPWPNLLRWSDSLTR